MFAYCGNNPLTYNDPTGQTEEAWKWWLDGASGYYTGGTSAYNLSLITTSSNSSVISLRSLVAKITAIAGTIAITASSVAPAACPNEDDDDSKKTIYIFRRNGTNPGNLVPREDDAALSFQLTPKRNSWVTTIDTLNSSGMFCAVIDGPNHVSVYPIGIDTYTWHCQGVLSPWTQELIKLCIKFK